MHTITKAFLWPGTAVCEWYDLDAKSDMGLMRSYINTLIWLPLLITLVSLISLAVI